ncbi:MAG: hypothetical protein MUE65_00805 [Methanomassiliicoccales archaeon]|jgi:uncharacterized protein YukE|nr:hypothetical protein [Methanomassiliicoccales archaeon]
MAEKDERTGSEKYAQELVKLLNTMGNEIEKAAAKFGKMGEEAYESMPPRAKSFTKDMQSVVDSIAENLRQDIPKLQRNMEKMAKRMGDYADDVQKAMKGEKK